MKHFFDDCSQIVSRLSFRHFVQIHKYSNERCLSICCHQCNDLILNCLYTSCNFTLHSFFSNCIDLVFTDFYTSCFHFGFYSFSVFLSGNIYEWCKMRKGDCLTTILVRCYLCNDLCCDIAGSRKAMRLINMCT